MRRRFAILGFACCLLAGLAAGPAAPRAAALENGFCLSGYGLVNNHLTIGLSCGYVDELHLEVTLTGPGLYSNHLYSGPGVNPNPGHDWYVDFPAVGPYTFHWDETMTWGNGSTETYSHDMSFSVDNVDGADTTAPSTGTPNVKPRLATLGGSTIPITVTWTGSDSADGSGIDHYDLQRSADGGATWGLSVAVTSKAYTTTVASSGTTTVRVRAIDKAGNKGGWDRSRIVTPRLVQQSGSSARWGGRWTGVTSTLYSGGSARYAKAAGAYVKYSFTARSVAFVTTKGPARGKVNLYVDGAYQKTVDLYRSSNLYRAAVWQKTFASTGTHTFKVVVAGTSGRPRVDADAFVVLK